MRSHRIVLAIALTALASCATPGPEQLPSQLGSGRISAEALIHSSPIDAGTSPEPLPDVDVLELSPEMQRFLDDHVRGRSSEDGRLRMLVFAVMGEGTFRLAYDETTRTAEQTFRDRRGNCLSFTNMFVAMARYLGLDAHYQEMDIPPDWSMVGEILLFSKHVNVVMRLSDGEHIMDFNMFDLRTDYTRHTISDQRARAHFYNNLGVEYMLDGRTRLALANYRKALDQDERFVPAWVDIGILHRREGFPDYAEAAYLQALRIEPHNLVAMSNLANLYEDEGIEESAAYYRERVEVFRMRNPYFRYAMARDAFADGDYRTAIEHLEYAVRQHEEDARFYSLLSMSYLMIGDRSESTKWMKKATEAATNREDRERYSNKLDLLMQEFSREK